MQTKATFWFDEAAQCTQPFGCLVGMALQVLGATSQAVSGSAGTGPAQVLEVIMRGLTSIAGWGASSEADAG
jgi:hypothetical protein